VRLSTRTRYGARLLFDLARHSEKGPIHIGDIAGRQGISVKYLEQIVRPLKEAKLVKSVRGAKGGHLLAKPAEEITLGQIVRLLESGCGLADCIEKPSECNMSGDCLFRVAWAEAASALFEKLDSISLAQLLAYEDKTCQPAGCHPRRSSGMDWASQLKE